MKNKCWIARPDPNPNPGIILCITLAIVTSASLSRAHDEILFFEPSPKQAEELTRMATKEIDGDKAVLRIRYVEITNWEDIFFNVVKSGLKGVKPEPIKLELFHDVRITIVSDFAQKSSMSTISWVGRIDNADRGENRAIFTIEFKRMKLLGTIRTNRRAYHIRPVDGPTHMIVELDPSKFPSEHGPFTSHFQPQSSHPKSGHSPLIDPNIESTSITTHPHIHELSSSQPICYIDNPRNTIDVLVVYTSRARQASNDTIKEEIEHALCQANMTFRDSQINQALRLADTCETSDETSERLEQDLQDLINEGSKWKEVRAWRNTAEADVVSLWVYLDEDRLGDYCGWAYPLANELGRTTSEHDKLAYSVVRWNETGTCPRGYSFAHEIGHLFGAKHDRQSEGASDNNYNYGHFNEKKTQRTIMGEKRFCEGCTRIGYWSNPKLYVYEDGTAVGVQDRADNHRAINDNAEVVASFKKGTGGLAGCSTTR